MQLDLTKDARKANNLSRIWFHDNNICIVPLMRLNLTMEKML